MAKKLKPDTITKADLTKFLSSESDFAFELSAIPLLRDSGWTVAHGGTYGDPVTGVNRQFDLRASHVHTPTNFANQRPWFAVSTHLAIECKNLKPNYPLLVSSVKRTLSESYLSLIVSDARGRVDVQRFRSVASGYRVDATVGKATEQVGLTEQGEFVRGDSEVYEKWSQAIASSADLVRAAPPAPPTGADVLFRTVVPILLVPDGTLWECRYVDGVLVREPEPADHVEAYIGKDWPVAGPLSFGISHLEIMTSSGFKGWLRDAKHFAADGVFGTQCFDLAKHWYT